MDRRQLLFGASALGLVTNLNLHHPLVAQVGNAVMGSRRLSDRERAGLRGPVKTCNDFRVDDAESMSEEEYAADGRLLVWRGRTFPPFSRAERVYCYDATGRLIGVISGDADVTDEFYYDELGRKTRVRTVPPRPGQQGRWAIAGPIYFDFIEEGYFPCGGGTITTRYNDDDQPIQSLVHDASGELLAQIVRNYANGRLVSEKLVQEGFDLPLQVQERLSAEHRRAARIEMKALLDRHDACTERSYVYDDQGRVIRCRLRMGNFREETTTTYNEHGDTAGTVTDRTGSLDPIFNYYFDNAHSEVPYLYQYDSNGNWTERTTTLSVSLGRVRMTHRRTLSYY
jgi:YD repeat-containing protein